MRILIDILHPAHVHFFLPFIQEMKTRGHEFLITSREKDCTLALLESAGLQHQLLSKQHGGAAALALELLIRTGRLIPIIRRFRPDVLTGVMGPSIALAGSICNVPALVFYDSEGARLSNWFTYRLAHQVITPKNYLDKVPGHHVTYDSYQKLAYLHPVRFKANQNKLLAYNISTETPYVLLRLVAWQASHDIGKRGLSKQQIRTLVSAASVFGKVLISAEGDLASDLQNLRINGPPGDFHHLLRFSSLVFTESLTVATESALLGVPVILISPFRYGYTEELEYRYHLLRRFDPLEFDKALQAIQSIEVVKARQQARQSLRKLFADKIDVTSWMVSHFENLPL